MWTRDTGTHDFHVGAWSLWLLAAMLATLSTRNPFYLTVVLLTALIVARAIGQRSEGLNAQQNRRKAEGGEQNAVGSKQYAAEDHVSRATHLDQSEIRNPKSEIQSLWRIVIIITLIVSVFKGLSNHLGETVLFVIPDWVPPPFAGPITLEALVSSWLDALTLITMLAVFAAFSAGADYYALLRSVPSAMRGAALVTSIGITFVPQTIRRWGEIREAQALRGHRVRRIADLLPLVIPLLAGGMERSMNLAEAMEARGFSRSTATAHALPPLLAQSGIAGGLGLLLVGSTMFAFAPDLPLLGWLLLGLGLGLVALTLWAASRGSRRTRYRRSVWRAHDTPLAIVAGGVLGILLVFRFVAPSLLAYTPFLLISMPDFDFLVALTLAALVAPAIIVRLRRSRPKIMVSP